MRLFVIGFLALILSAVPLPARETGAARDMREAATAFLASLDAAQRQSATFTFDADERTNWHYNTRQRKGLALSAMTDAQRKAAVHLIRTGLSAKGFDKAEAIRQMEIVLGELQKTSRSPEYYLLAVFGEPKATAPWGWRYEGHHLSQNWTVVEGQAVASSPQFFGSNPAEVRAGPKTGTRILAAEEDLARSLVTSLDAQQRADAIVGDVAPLEMMTADNREALRQPDVGITYAKLSKGQRELLMRIIDEYAHAQVPAIAEARLARVRQGGLDVVRFAWIGPVERGKPHYYRIQGAEFLIEYDNTQNEANHAHAVWRDFKGDFGRDLLAEHYRTAPHHAGQIAAAEEAQRARHAHTHTSGQSEQPGQTDHDALHAKGIAHTHTHPHQHAASKKATH